MIRFLYRLFSKLCVPTEWGGRRERWSCVSWASGPFRRLGVAVWLGMSSAGMAQPRLVDGDFLQTLRTEVRTNHPTVAAAQARWRAAESALRGVRLWEDPMAGFGVLAADAEMRRENGDLVVMAEQSLPRRRLYEARRAQASAERARFDAETRSAALELESRVVQVTIELAMLDEMIAIERRQLEWLESMAANARERLKDPMGNASEPLRIESEAAMERQRVEAYELRREHLARQINLLLGRAEAAPWDALRLPAEAPPTPALGTLLDRLFEVSPMLQGTLGMVRAADAEIAVARRERSPMYVVGVDTRVYSGGDFREAEVVVKMTLPWVNRSVYREAEARATHLRTAAERDGEALARRLRSEVIGAHSEAENAASQARTLAGEVLPRAAKAAEATQVAWVSSKASLLEVLESQRMLLTARLEERRAIAEHGAALEMLRSIVPPHSQP